MVFTASIKHNEIGEGKMRRCKKSPSFEGLFILQP